MYAIVDIAGQQFKVEKDQKLYVHRLEGEEGNQVSFDKVLLIDTGSKIAVGDPVVKGAAVDAKIISHVKADKVLVFKKKRRKGYQKLNGHRQYMTQIQIETIFENKPASGDSKAKTTKEAVAAPVKAAVAEKSPAAPSKAGEATKKAAPEVKKAETAKASTVKKPAAGKTAAAKKPAAAKSTAAKSTTAKATATKKPAPKKPAAKAAPKKKSGEDKA